MRTPFIFFILCFSFLFVITVKAQETPTSTTATYGSWVVRCSTVTTETADTATPEKLCEMAQTMRLRETGQTILEIALGRLNDNEPISLVFQVPPTVWLRDDIQLSLGTEIKATPDFLASYFRCSAQSCLADGQIVPALREALLADSAMIVEFVEASRNKVRVPVSLEGFSAAFAATFPDNQGE